MADKEPPAKRSKIEPKPAIQTLEHDPSAESKTGEPNFMSRYILIVGQSGKGKSACANVLTGITDEPCFIENHAGTSNKPTIHDVDVNMKEGKMKLRIIEAVGFRQFPFDEAMTSLASICKDHPRGFHHVLFVLRGRCDRQQIACFQAIYNVIFAGETNALEHTTIIRTGFQDWEDPDVCKTDIQDLRDICRHHDIQFDKIKGVVHLNCVNQASKAFRTTRNDCHERLISQLPDLSIGRLDLSKLSSGMDKRIDDYLLSHGSSRSLCFWQQQVCPLSAAQELEAPGSARSLTELLSKEDEERGENAHKHIKDACKVLCNQMRSAFDQFADAMKNDPAIQQELRQLSSTGHPTDPNDVGHLLNALLSRFEELEEYVNNSQRWNSTTSRFSLRNLVLCCRKHKKCC